jgi:hypothetical protein
MTPSFDIFRAEDEGDVLWIGATATLEEAKAHVEELTTGSRGEYFIRNMRTGDRFAVKVAQ